MAVRTVEREENVATTWPIVPEQPVDPDRVGRRSVWSLRQEAVVPLPLAHTRLFALCIQSSCAWGCSMDSDLWRSMADEMVPPRYIHWVNVTGQ